MSSVSLDRRARRLVVPGLALVAVAVLVAACGGGSGNSGSPAPAGPQTRASSAPSRPGNQPPGTFGTAAAVSASSIEVQNPQNGQVTVNFNGSTTFTNTTSATLADVTVGSCVVVTSTSGGVQPKAMTARTVSVTPASANGCAAGAFGGGGGGFAGRPSGAPRPSNRPRPSGQPANIGRAFGSVTAVTASGFTVHGVARGTTPASDTAVTVDSSTTYTKTASATSSALAVGECIAAIGPSDDTGAVTARTIAISKPGPSGCVAGGGRFRGGFGGGNG